jgi:hypothetical protein
MLRLLSRPEGIKPDVSSTASVGPMETTMTMITRWTLTVGLACACACALAGTGNAQADDRLLKLLQLQTLNRMAPQGPPAKKDASDDSSAHQDRAADPRGAQPQPDNRGAPNNVPARKQ